MEARSSLGENGIGSSDRLFPEPQIRTLHKLLQSPAWSWNKRQQIKPNNFQPLLWTDISYYLTKELQMFNLPYVTKLDNTGERGSVTALTAATPQTPSVLLIKGQGRASTTDPFLGHPEAEAFRRVCVAVRITSWNVERKYESINVRLPIWAETVSLSVSWTTGWQTGRWGRKLRSLPFSSMPPRVSQGPEDSETDFNSEHNLLKSEV